MLTAKDSEYDIVTGLDAGVTTHIAMLHTIFNICATAIFVPFVNQIATIVRKVERAGDCIYTMLQSV